MSGITVVQHRGMQLACQAREKNAHIEQRPGLVHEWDTSPSALKRMSGIVAQAVDIHHVRQSRATRSLRHDMKFGCEMDFDEEFTSSIFSIHCFDLARDQMGSSEGKGDDPAVFNCQCVPTPFAPLCRRDGNKNENCKGVLCDLDKDPGQHFCLLLIVAVDSLALLSYGPRPVFCMCSCRTSNVGVEKETSIALVCVRL